MLTKREVREYGVFNLMFHIGIDFFSPVFDYDFLLYYFTSVSRRVYNIIMTKRRLL